MVNKKLNIHHLSTKLAIINLIVIALCIIYSSILDYLPYFSDNTIYQGAFATFWFDGLGYFTNQTNLLILVVTILYLTAYKTKLFDNGQLVFLSAVYITLTALLCWAVLVPITIAYSTAIINISMSINIATMHLVTPTLFIVFAFFQYRHQSLYGVKAKFKYKKQLLIGVIYPVVYVVYLITINFISLPISMFRDGCFPPQGYVSIYAVATNFNPQCFVPSFKNGSTIPTYTDYSGSLVFLVVPFLFIAFSIGIICLYVYVTNRIFYPKQIKNV